MVGADMVFGVALFLPADRGALVAAGVDKGPHPAPGVARNDDRRATDVRSEEIVRLRDLRLQAEEVPDTLENVFHLELEELRVAENVLVDPENPFFRAVIDV